jgi:hypothetical protein
LANINPCDFFWPCAIQMVLRSVIHRVFSPHQMTAGSKRSGEDGSRTEMAFTIVFPGPARQFAGNPFDAETPFGKVQTISIGDVCAQSDVMREALEQIEEGNGVPADIAQEALRQVNKMMTAEISAGRA